MTQASTPRLLGIEIGATKLQGVVGRGDGYVERRVRIAADAAGGAEAILAQVCGIVESLIADAPAEGIGIGFGGPVNAANGVVVKSHQVEGWNDRPLRDWAQNTFDLPCRLANDTDAATLAEATVGAGRGKSCVFYTNIGSGIGGGLTRDGHPYMGRGSAVEFGHTWGHSTLLDRWDHVEYLCSGWAVAGRARQMLEQDRSGALIELCDGDVTNIEAPMVFEAWQNGDALATRLIDDVLETLGRSLCNVIALLDPDIIVIGGGMALVGEPLLEAIRAAVAAHVFEPFADHYKIEPSQLGEMAVPVGALLLAGQSGG